MLASWVMSVVMSETVVLWPQGAPGALGEEDKDVPKLTVSVPEPCHGVAVVVCPGGGYGHLAMGHEGRDVAAWLNSHGVVAAVLEYRHRGKGYGHPAPLLDAQRAIRTVRHRAEEWSVDPAKIGVLGFSAGGHLAATATTLFDRGPRPEDGGVEPDAIDAVRARPDFSVLVYPVILTEGPNAHRGSVRNLLGEQPDPQLRELLSPVRQVADETPPVFLVHSSDDRGVTPENSIAFYSALREKGIDAELHVYRRGGHGYGLGREDLPARGWPDDCIAWIADRGLLPR